VQGPHGREGHGAARIAGRLLICAVAAAVTLGGAAARAAPPRVVLTLVDPSTLLTPEPPLTAPVVGEQEPQIFRQRVNSKQRVAVGVDSAGRPVSVTATQRLHVIGKGDYLYTIAAPVRTVTATPDSESVPGQRQGAILWAGFSPGSRRLGAVARLDLAHPATLLPLKLSIRATVDGTPLLPGERRSGLLRLSVTLVNATQTTAPSALAGGDRGAIVRALDLARRGVYPLGGVSLSVEPPVAAATAVVEAPLTVAGEVTLPTGRVIGAPADAHGFRFATVLGDGRPLRRQVVRFTGRVIDASAPRIRLVARPFEPRRTVRPPAGSTWAEAVRLDRRLDSRRLLTIAENAYLRAARARQFDTFLANPGPPGVGVNTAVYVYATAPRVVVPPPPRRSGELGLLGIALIVAGGVAAAGGLAVTWAHL
jgi:hypothetical protein